MQQLSIEFDVESINSGFRMIIQRFDNEYTDFNEKFSKNHPQVNLEFGVKNDLKPSFRSKYSQQCISKHKISRRIHFWRFQSDCTTV